MGACMCVRVYVSVCVRGGGSVRVRASSRACAKLFGATYRNVYMVELLLHFSNNFSILPFFWVYIAVVAAAAAAAATVTAAAAFSRQLS